MEVDHVPAGIYNVTPTTFLPKQEGPFFLDFSSTSTLKVSQLQWRWSWDWEEGTWWHCGIYFWNCILEVPRPPQSPECDCCYHFLFFHWDFCWCGLEFQNWLKDTTKLFWRYNQRGTLIWTKTHNHQGILGQKQKNISAKLENSPLQASQSNGVKSSNSFFPNKAHSSSTRIISINIFVLIVGKSEWFQGTIMIIQTHLGFIGMWSSNGVEAAELVTSLLKHSRFFYFFTGSVLLRWTPQL